jgi:succinyl-CoA synthetase beta subunit
VLKANDAAEAATAAATLFAREFGGERPDAVLIEPWQAITRELYLSITVDGLAGGYLALYAPKGGVNIEDGPPPVRYAFGLPANFRAWRFRAAIEAAEPDRAVREKVVTLAERLVGLAQGRDCTTIEINPLAVLEDGRVLPLDAKVVRDDWAHFRQDDIRLAREAERAREPRLVRDCLEMQHMYVPLDGDVALISGGAGMTMAAMDMIKDFGGAPACFLDCSPGPASTRGYRPAFAMLDADPKVKVILVSVFGGGTHMDRVAGAMRDILSERASAKPVVFRLDGTHVDQVPALLDQVNATNHASLETAVREAVALARRSA